MDKEPNIYCNPRYFLSLSTYSTYSTHTHWTNLPRIRRLCLWVSWNVFCRTPSTTATHPPTHAKHCLSLSLLSELWRGLRLGCPDLPRHKLYKHSPVLSRAPESCPLSTPFWAPSLKRCFHWPDVAQSKGEPACSQLASKSTSAIWHRLRCFNRLKQPVFVICEQSRKCFTSWLLLFIVFHFR